MFPILLLFWAALVRYVLECSSVCLHLVFSSWLGWGWGPPDPFLWGGMCCHPDVSLLMLILITWLRQCLSGFSLTSLHILVVFCLFVCLFLRWRLLRPAHSQGGRRIIKFILFEERVSTYLICNSSVKKIILFLFVYLFNQTTSYLYKYVLMGMYLDIAL